MISTAIILAGGLGTRLRSVVNDIPKCMAPVAGYPFLKYVMDQLLQQGITHFILSVGYKRGVIIDYLQETYPQVNIRFAIEEEPLGTGGAVKLAATLSTEKNVFVVNGDTIFEVNLNLLSDVHLHAKADCTLALKPMKNFDRYGVVEINAHNRITSFKEKKWYESGLINGGIYALNTVRFSQEDLPSKFSFEKDYLESFSTTRLIYGCVSEGYFIDIGIPEDYERAQIHFSHTNAKQS
ncbi:MAG TPA: nucleotidyltransferase family protein [Lacibacter sp.]|nr:nucleotidyltransferase family protein [Lacibacter sp.]